MGGQSSKIQFGNNLNTLMKQDIDPNNHVFWDELWKTPLTIEDIFNIITPTDIRRLCIGRPKNIKTIFTQAIAQLYQIVETPYPIYFNQALNCIRILARFLPTMIEFSQSKRISDLFWKRQSMLMHTRGGGDDATDTTTITAHPTESGGKLRHTDTNNKSPDSDSSPRGLRSHLTSPRHPDTTGGHNYDTQESEPLAVILINTLFHILFLPDFTIEDPHIEFVETDATSNEFRSALMWSSGVGSAGHVRTPQTSAALDRNRLEVLRLMLSAFCETLYMSPEQVTELYPCIRIIYIVDMLILCSLSHMYTCIYLLSIFYLYRWQSPPRRVHGWR